MVTLEYLIESTSKSQWGTERNGDILREKAERQREIARGNGVSPRDEVLKVVMVWKGVPTEKLLQD